MPGADRPSALPQHDHAPADPLVELFTDGACLGNPGPGGWAFILRHPASGKTIERSGGERRTTNNRMELLSVINGLEALDRPCRVVLTSDSQYVTRGINEWLEGWKAKGWKRGGQAVKNLELWKHLDRLLDRHQVIAVWIRGHSAHPENTRCDQLAVAAAKRALTGKLRPEGSPEVELDLEGG